MVFNRIQVRVSKPQYFSFFVDSVWRSALSAINQTILVNLCDTRDSPCESDTDSTSVALRFQKANCAQFLKHFGLSLYSSIFSAQKALLSRCVFASVWIQLTNDSLLLAATQCLANATSQYVARRRLNLPKQSRRPFFQRFQSVGHFGTTHSLPVPCALGIQF